MNCSHRFKKRRIFFTRRFFISGTEKDLIILLQEILIYGRKKQIRAIIAPVRVRNIF